ncbi:MAG: branched-chain amino acid aminotransferase, partial [Nevskia sp.]|nr:branched-chain amino acid aminotransferase [Nevskia sp.]
EVMPIREADNRCIGGGKRGPVTEKLQKAYTAQVKGERAEYPEWLSLVQGHSCSSTFEHSTDLQKLIIPPSPPARTTPTAKGSPILILAP